MKHDPTEKLKGELGPRIRWLRLARGLTQTQLGERCGLTTAMICHLERTNRLPGLESLVRVAHALDSTASELLEGL